jgi:hypothetical protein
VNSPTSNKTENPPPKININSLNPCFYKTPLSRDTTGVVRLFFCLFAFLFARTAEEGSRLVVQAAAAGRDSRGEYFRSAALRAYEPFITDYEGLERREYIWKCLTKLEDLQPGVMECVGV